MSASRGRSVLIVDDDPEFRALLRDVLETAGFEVIGEASDGAEAVRLALEVRPELITMDMEMPVMDGSAATAAIRAGGSAAAIVVVSGSSSSDLLAAALDSGARWHVAKRDIATKLPGVLESLLRHGGRKD